MKLVFKFQTFEGEKCAEHRSVGGGKWEEFILCILVIQSPASIYMMETLCLSRKEREDDEVMSLPELCQTVFQFPEDLKFNSLNSFFFFYCTETTLNPHYNSCTSVYYHLVSVNVFFTF